MGSFKEAWAAAGGIASSCRCSCLSMSMSMVVAGDLGSPAPNSPILGGGRTDWGLLPQALLEEVLRRLPIAAQLRFRSVSKRWREILSSPAFLWDCSPAAPGPAALLALQARFKLEELPEHPYPLPRPLSFHGLPPLRELPGPMLPCASDAGLVCFSSRAREQGLSFFLVLNPMTRAWRKLPAGPPRAVWPPIAALLVDSVSKAYTLVVAAANRGKEPWTLHVYEASKDAWEECGRAPQRFLPDCPGFCRGVLYFLDSHLRLFGWSLEGREFLPKTIPAPPELESARLLQHQGELLLVGLLYGSFTSYGIWRLLPEGAWREVAFLTSSFFQALFSDCGARDHSWSVLSFGDSVCLDLRLYDMQRKGDSTIVDPVGRRVLLAFDFSFKVWFVMPLQFRDTLDSKSRSFLLSFEPRLDSIV